MRRVRTLACVVAIVVAGCSGRDVDQPSTAVEPTADDPQLVGTFTLDLGPDGRGTRSAVLVPAGAGPGRVLITQVDISFDPVDCGGPGRVCVDYELTNNTGDDLTNLTAVLDAVAPPSSAAVDDDPLPAFLATNPKHTDDWGVWQYGDVADGDSATERWIFPYSGSTVRVRGKLFAEQLPEETNCDDATDDDGDGDIDCADSDCDASLACMGFGAAVAFAGSGSCQTSGAGQVPTGSSARTVELWAHIETADWAPNRHLFSFGMRATRQYFGIDMHNHPQFEFVTWADDGVQSSDGSSGWHHVAMVYGGGTQVTTYVDGVPSTVNLGATLATGSSNVVIGSGGGDLFFTGRIDEVRVWNVARTQSQIQDNMHGPVDPASSDLAHYWRFDEGAGTTVADATGNGLPCTLTNAVWTSGPPPLSCNDAASCRLFVTSTRYGGNLGGLAGADAKCQEAADAASLGGTWKAWLSDSDEDARDRLMQATVPYVRVDGASVVANFAGFGNGTPLTNMMTLDEFGDDTSSFDYFFTFAEQNGTRGTIPSTLHCQDWTVTSSDIARGGRGLVVQNPATGLGWSNNVDANCIIGMRLLCLEQ